MDTTSVSFDGFAQELLEECGGVIVIYYTDASTISL